MPSPAEPKRTAAQRKNGNGANISGETVIGDEAIELTSRSDAVRHARRIRNSANGGPKGRGNERQRSAVSSGGARTIVERTFVTNRIRQCIAGSEIQPVALNVAAEISAAIAGAPIAAINRNAVTPFSVPSISSTRTSGRRRITAISGCERLPVNMPSERPIGRSIVPATASCVSSAKPPMIGHILSGEIRKAMKRRTFGGQSTAMLGSVGIISRA